MNGVVRITTDPDEAARALASGHLAAVPTETVYGLGARADLPRAIDAMANRGTVGRIIVTT